ncbi:AraC family transcriptional regulator [Chitinophaga horti]|uniref:AraC family transcriptional regulator n=1 Tax=Chitinophaga horti TaxID=2920382 RepID=A0ABY6J148_9BACT|nr:AraC family transcriptional regulator [Chitinophaga horti]UYQ93409.1 AraC family transcriptional regulator [Chitinophaga horti]
MKVIISNKHNDVLSSTDMPAIAPFAGPDYNEISYTSNEPYWKSQASEIRYGGTHIATHDVNILEPVQVRTVDAPTTVSLFFVEKGAITTKARQTWEISAMQHNLLFSAYATDLTLFEKQQALRLSIISFTPERFLAMSNGGGRFMETIANSIVSGKNFSLSEKHNFRLSLRMLEILKGFRSTPYQASAKSLLMESRVLELLALQCEQFEQDERPAETLRLSTNDIKKLHAVRDMLLTDIAYTPSLAELSKLNGLNEFKLKAGFKQLFQQTVFSFLRDARMEHALKELKKDDKSLTEIAYECGFATLSHFSDVFKKKYGVAPKKMR